MGESRQEDFISKLETDPEYKKKFVIGLERLGFPLEFRIRKKLSEQGFGSVTNGHFNGVGTNGKFVGEYDVDAYKSMFGKVLNNTSLEIGMCVIGECKFSSDPNRAIIALPSPPEDYFGDFVGPILTSLQGSNENGFWNSITHSNFLKRYGSMPIASAIVDTDIRSILGKFNAKDESKLPDYEKIYTICESTILPAVREKYIEERKLILSKYEDILSTEHPPSSKEYMRYISDWHFGSTILVPVIITSKPILIPKFRNGKIEDVCEVNYLLYEHTLRNPEQYRSLVGSIRRLAVFICTEKGFIDLMNYLDNLHNNIFTKVRDNISKNPHSIYLDFREIKKGYGANREI